MTSVLYNMHMCSFLYGVPLLSLLPLGVLEYSASGNSGTFYTYNYNFIIKNTTQNSQIKMYKGARFGRAPDMELPCSLPIETGYATFLVQCDHQPTCAAQLWGQEFLWGAHFIDMID